MLPFSRSESWEGKRSMIKKTTMASVVAGVVLCGFFVVPAFADRPGDRPERCHPEWQVCKPTGGGVVPDQAPLHAMR
jgi:hypothetical protein